MLTGLCSARGSAALLWDQRQTQGQGDAKSAQQEEQREQGGECSGCPCFDHWKGKAKIELKNPARQNRAAVVLMVVFP